MKFKSFGLFLATVLILFACSQPSTQNQATLLDGSNIDQGRLEFKENKVHIDGYRLSDLGSKEFEEGIILLASPNQFDCGTIFYASSQGQLYYFELGGMGGDQWIGTYFGDDPTAYPSSENFSHLEDCYFRNDHQVIYQGRIVKDADPDTFKPLEMTDSFVSFGVDKNGVYMNHKKVSDDPKNFTSIGDNYFKDSKYVYNGSTVVEGAEPNTFSPLDPFYSVDEEHVFYQKKMIPGADRDSLELIEGTSLAKDKNAVYFWGEKQADADGFEMMKVDGEDSNYFKNKDFTFYLDRGLKVIEALDPATLKVFEGGYAADEEEVFRYGKKISGADGETFEALGEDAGKDANKVFIRDSELVGADAQTIEFVEIELDEGSEGYPYYRHGFLKDKKEVYIDGEPMGIEGVDTASIEYVSSSKLKDKNHVYCKPDQNHEWVIMEDADPATFENQFSPGFSRDEDDIYSYCFKDIHGSYEASLEWE